MFDRSIALMSNIMAPNQNGETTNSNNILQCKRSVPGRKNLSAAASGSRCIDLCKQELESICVEQSQSIKRSTSCVDADLKLHSSSESALLHSRPWRITLQVMHLQRTSQNAVLLQRFLL
jgi:hypothetical protein